MKKKISERDIKHMNKLHAEGMSYMGIAIKKKMSFWTVKYHLDESYRSSVITNNINRNRAIAKKKKDEGH